MKKRKPPIVAITILIVCLAVAAGFNYKSGINPKAVASQEAAPPTSEVKVGETRATQDPKQVADLVKKQAGTSAPSTAPPQGGPRQKMMMGKQIGPSIALPKMGSSKPVPNDSSISSQWYQNSSSKSGQ